MLPAEQVAANLEGIGAQLGGLLDMTPRAGKAQALLLDNSRWLSAFGLIEFLREVGKHFTVNQMVAKESVRTRLERPEQGISYTEFSYMLLQAYDYLYLHDNYGCSLQIGGSDQWGNITMGIELIRKVRGAQAYALTFPLLLRSDGAKYGKSESGAVWLDPSKTSPYAMYQFFVRTPDNEVGTLLRQFTFLSANRSRRSTPRPPPTPRSARPKRPWRARLSLSCTARPRPSGPSRRRGRFSPRTLPFWTRRCSSRCSRTPPRRPWLAARLDGGGLGLVEVLVSTGLFSSKTLARTAVGQGGVYLNNRRRNDPEDLIRRDDLLVDRYVVLRRGPARLPPVALRVSPVLPARRASGGARRPGTRRRAVDGRLYGLLGTGCQSGQPVGLAVQRCVERPERCPRHRCHQALVAGGPLKGRD